MESPGAVLSQIGAAVPGITIVMDHFAGKATTFDVEDSWKADMHAAAAYPGLNIKVSDVHKLSSQVVTGRPAGLTQFQPVADPSSLCAYTGVSVENLWRGPAYLRHQLACERCRRYFRGQHRPGNRHTGKLPGRTVCRRPGQGDVPECVEGL